ncbi:MAG: DciA family protein [Pseudomonadota bacterium]
MARPRKGPRRVAALVSRDIRRLSESRGFSETRLLTHWADIAGAQVAAISRPVKVGYPRGGVGAVLTLLTTGANAPVLSMRLPELREKVNACYGYNAISRIDITQTAPTGFAEGQVAFAPAPPKKLVISPDIQRRAKNSVEDVGDQDLRQALERLGANIISKTRA